MNEDGFFAFYFQDEGRNKEKEGKEGRKEGITPLTALLHMLYEE